MAVVGDWSTNAARESLSGSPYVAQSAEIVACRASLYMFMGFTSMALVITPLSGFMLFRCCEDAGLDRDHCKSDVPGFDQAQVSVSRISSMWQLTMGVGNLLTCSFLGRLGDAYGRRFTILLPNFHSIIYLLVLAFVPWSLFLTLGMGIVLLSSCLGGTFVLCQGVFAMLADAPRSLPEKKRARLYSWVESSIWIAMLIGPSLGSVVNNLVGEQRTFLVGAAISLINVIIILGTFKETLEPERRTAVKWQHVNPFGALMRFATQPSLRLLGFLTFAMLLAGSGGMSVVSQYMLRIDKSATSVIGLLITSEAIFSLVGLMLLFPLLLKHMSSNRIMLLSTLVSAAGWMLRGAATRPWHFFALVPLISFTCLFLPVIRLRVSSDTSSGPPGEALGAIASLEQLSMLVSGPLMNNIYAATIGVSLSLPGGIGIHCVTFAVCAVIALLAAVASAAVGEAPGNLSSEVEHEGDAVCGSPSTSAQYLAESQ